MTRHDVLEKGTIRSTYQPAEKHVARETTIMTDESTVYPSIAKDFAAHGTVNHSADEYVRMGGYYHVNTAEWRCATFKRGVYAHLGRYLAEFDFKANTRGLSDRERCGALLAATKGRRLVYENPRGTAHA